MTNTNWFGTKFFRLSFLVMGLTIIQIAGFSQEDTTEKTKAKGVDRAAAQPDIPKGEKHEPAPQKPEILKKAAPKPIQVIAVYNANHRINNRENTDKNYDSASIGDIIVIRVSNFDSLMRRSKCTDSSGNAYINCRTQKIRLFINGRMINDIEPISGAPDKDEGTFQFRLDRNTDNDDIWADILGAPALFTNKFFVKPVKISVGLENEYAVETAGTSDYNFQLIRIHRGWFWSCFMIVILYLLIIFSMARSKGLLRDRGIDLSALGIKNDSILNPYSLGRFQMAFWFTLTIISFFFIWLITDAYNIITPTVLTLIGISAGTALSAAVIDNSKSTELLNQTVALQNELDGLNTKMVSLSAQLNIVPAPANLIDLQTQKNIAQDRIDQATRLITQNTAVLTPQPSQGFFKDILRDVNGVSFHRLQMLVWTFVLGLLFIYSVWKRLSMPVFDATLLALQGLTATTYLGFKFPEKQV